MNQAKTGLLLVNLGTPTEPTPSAVRTFLSRFLSDPLVVRIPRLLWLPILWCFILPFRSKKVAKLYQKIWQEEGSPLEVITKEQCRQLAKLFNQKKTTSAEIDVNVAYAMVYGEPSIAMQLQQWQSKNYDSVVVLPLYPQYSSTTTACVERQVACFKKQSASNDNVSRDFKKKMDISLIESYFSHPCYIEALVSSVQSLWQQQSRGERLLISFHGLPQKIVDEGDPYYKQCQKTALFLAKELNLSETEWSIGFQSRFGPAEWLKPYSDEVIERWAKEGVKNIDVIAPAFAADCLETLEEIAVQYADDFSVLGGEKLSVIPCLNSSEKHIQMMMNLFLDAHEKTD